jgi:selenocysteine lyase/cysteine desulfurase
MKGQKNKFDFPEDVSYLNCAYLGPALKASQKAGNYTISKTGKPYLIKSDDFFEPVEKLRSSFAQLIGCSDSDRIAVNISVSYGLANVIKQIVPREGSNVVIPEEEFPSNVHAWRRFCERFDCELRTISIPEELANRGEAWNESILNAIDENTCAVAITPLHWSGGTIFDLEGIGEKCRLNQALFIVDGTQGIGAIKFDVEKLKPDVLLCSGYKWLLGPYGISLAYYGSYFDNGVPIEENWITHKGSDDFKSLVKSSPDLLEKASRYSSGQHPSFIYVSMLQEAIDQLLEWGSESIIEYCRSLHDLFVQEIQHIEGLYLQQDEKYFSPHLFGLWFPKDVDLNKLKSRLEKDKIFVSLRGNIMRISIHVFNDESDILRLANGIRKFLEIS